MRINELRLYGFKSFANKTSIKFDTNYVGIVGPNGSGKSNIIDAIRWVFGEQSSKNLRGKKSTDVIFAGTEKKKKLHFCEVTLVLDNTDHHLPIEYDEVEITRRLYNSGESEYLLNKTECRLKDIMELTMDSGMGKNSFSIISQGQVDQIINQKPEERRQVVEEVAGLIKYKKRKETALRKMAKTEENLNYVAILLSEMEERLIPLEKQREKAIKYLECKKGLEKYELSYLVNLIEQNTDDIKALQTLKDSFQIELLEVTTKINSNDTDIFVLEEEIKTLAQQKDHFQLEYNKVVREATNLSAEIKIVNERLINSTSDDADKQALDLQNIINDLKIKSKENLQKFNDIQKKQEEIKIKFDSCEEQIETLRQKRREIESKLAVIEENIAIHSYPNAVKSIVKANKFPNAKVVKDLFTTNDMYLEAISISLGNRGLEILMENLNEIKEAIKFLSDKRLGRASFITINSVRPRPIDPDTLKKAKTIVGFVDIAINLIDFDEEHEPIFNSILGSTIIAQNLDYANKISKAIGSRYPVVTLDGDVVATTGTITGGKTKHVNSLLLNNDRVKYQKLLETINADYSNATKDIQHIEKSFHEIRIEKNVINEEKINLQKEIELKNFELSNIDTSELVDSNDLNQKLSKLHDKEIELNSKLQEVSKILEEKTFRKNELSSINRNLFEENKDLLGRENANNVKLSRLETLVEGAYNTFANDYNISFNMAAKNAERNIDIVLYKEKIDMYKREIKSIGMVNIDSIKEYDEIKVRFDFIVEQKNDLELAQEKLTNIIKTLDDFAVKQFEVAFYKLRDEFRKIYGEIFGGGKADLILTDPNDLLTSGVEIIAQPPGKKLQTMTLLSGGEKALTSISLLFAKLRISVVPFAILDEVEAALDEANVLRYANFTKVFSERTQFLVITHRKGTMETFDRLYGVTMAEKGVSTVVNARLDNKEIDV